MPDPQRTVDSKPQVRDRTMSHIAAAGEVSAPPYILHSFLISSWERCIKSAAAFSKTETCVCERGCIPDASAPQGRKCFYYGRCYSRSTTGNNYGITKRKSSAFMTPRGLDVTIAKQHSTSAASRAVTDQRRRMESFPIAWSCGLCVAAMFSLVLARPIFYPQLTGNNLHLLPHFCRLRLVPRFVLESQKTR